MSLARASEIVDGTMFGGDVEFSAVTTDSRTARGGELFVALHGPNFDGHEFVAQAAAAGVAAAMLARAVKTDLPYVQVTDTRQALGILAAHWRRHFDVPVVGVTGSNGKTTVKEMIGAILGIAGPGLITKGNLNNEIGVPLTLLRMRSTDRFAVVEMGMNHSGEIAYLTGLTAPTVAVITNAAAAHLEGLKTVEGVAHAKGEIFAGLADDGVAVINADDTFAALWHRLAGDRRCITFGLERPADVTAEYQTGPNGSTLRIHSPVGAIDVQLPLFGKHNVLNALAATSAAVALDVSTTQIQQGLEAPLSMTGRLQLRRGLDQAQVLDDSYNANPASVAAGLDVLLQFGGDTILVLGDMAELGDNALEVHQTIGRQARQAGVRRLLTLGPLSAAASKAFGAGARHCASVAELVDILRAEMHADATVLVKGSRSAHMEQVVARICAGESDAGDVS